MDNNQRQDWWPNGSQGPEENTSSGAENQGQPNIPDTDQNQNNPYNSWNPQQDQNQNNQYNGWNPQQDQNQNNPYNQYNNWNNGGQNFNGGYPPYNHMPNRRPPQTNNGMSIASLVMGILSVVLICCGLSYFFGALGILFAILSRRNNPMDTQAKVGLGLSITGTVIGLLLVLFILVGNNQYSQILEEYNRFYHEYEDGYDSYDDYYDGYEDYYDDFFDSYEGEDFYFDGPFQNLPQEGNWNWEDLPNDGGSL